MKQFEIFVYTEHKAEPGCRAIACSRYLGPAGAVGGLARAATGLARAALGGHSDNKVDTN
jgi:hypothetical protein